MFAGIGRNRNPDDDGETAEGPAGDGSAVVTDTAEDAVEAAPEAAPGEGTGDGGMPVGDTDPADIGTGRMIDGTPAPGGCPYVLVRRTDSRATIPHAMNQGDAGFDLAAVDDVEIRPGGRVVADTGIAVAIPRGFAGFVLSRSGLAAKRGIAVLNAPGLIDSGYRDSIKVILVNTGDSVETLKGGDRVAQLVIQRVEDPGFIETGTLPGSDRGAAGLGSTGLSAERR